MIMEDVEPTKSAITFTVLLIGWLVQCCHQRKGTASVGSNNSTILVEDCFSNLVNEPEITIMSNPKKLVTWCEVHMACISFTKEANGTSSSLCSKQPETKYMKRCCLGFLAK